MSYPDPQMRSEIYWKSEDLVGEDALLNPSDLLYRPIALEAGRKRCFEVSSDGRSSKVALVSSFGKEGIGVILGFRAEPLENSHWTGPVRFDQNLVYDLPHPCKLEVPIFRIGRRRFVRICERSSRYLLVPMRPRLSRREEGLLHWTSVGSGAIHAWLPHTEDGLDLVLQEFPDTVAVVTRSLGDDGAETTRIVTMPYEDWSIGELMGRCTRAHLETVRQMKVGGTSFPVRQFFLKPTAWLESALVVGEGEQGEVILDLRRSISTSLLKSSRLLSFVVARELPTTPCWKHIAVDENPPRLVLLDQGGARGPVVRTEPRKWRSLPGGMGMAIANGLKYLTTVLCGGSSYNMRSEALEEFRSAEWRAKPRFMFNDLEFAGDRPCLAAGDLALFVFETGQPELVQTIAGRRMQVVSEARVARVQVFITHAHETEDDKLYVDGYRSTGGLTAVDFDQVDPVDLIRGGRLRWRPKEVSMKFLRSQAAKGRFPIVFSDRSSTINVAVSMIPNGYLVAPALRGEASKGSLRCIRRQGCSQQTEEKSRQGQRKRDGSHEKVKSSS